MAKFTFYDKIHKKYMLCASMEESQVTTIEFSRQNNYEHTFSDEIYFKKIDNENEAKQFSLNKWYQANELEYFEEHFIIKDWIEKDPFKEDNQSYMQNVIQLIGNNNNFSGNTINLGDIKLDVFLKALEDSIEANPDIPEDTKKNILTKLKEFANTPYVSGLLVNSIFNYIQPFLLK